MTKILTVVGATGSQGSSVINAMLPLASKWSIRAITRSPYSSAGQALQARGVEVIAADLTDAASVKAAFAGSYAIFAMTDFFQPFMAVGLDIARAEEIERTHCVNIIEAAASTTTLEHFIWSTLPPAERNSKHREAGPYDIPHFKGKNQVEDEIKSMPKLLAKTTFVWVGWYASNFQYPIFKPAFMKEANTHILTAPIGPDTPINTIGDMKANLGKFIRATLQQPDLTKGGRYVSAVIAKTSFGGVLEDWSKATGKPSAYLQVSSEAYERLWGAFGAVEGANLRYFEEYGKLSWDISGETVLTARDLGLSEKNFVGVKAFVKSGQLEL